jgi:hypothetical protein
VEKKMKQIEGFLLKNIPERKFRNALRERRDEHERILQGIKGSWMNIDKASRKPRDTAKKITSRSLQQRDG